MKRTVLVCILFLMGAVSVVNAQFSQIHVGAAFPSGNFGDGNAKSQEYFLDGVGFAATGFNVGYKYYSPFSSDVKNLFFVLGLDLYYNGMNSDAKFAMEKMLNDDVDVNFPAYLNIPVMGGLNFTHLINDKIGIYGEGSIGLNYSKITKFEWTSKEETMTASFDPAFKFSYAAEAGLIIKDTYSIGIRYHQLGSYKFKYKEEYDTDRVSDKESYKFRKALTITNLALTVGVFF